MEIKWICFLIIGVIAAICLLSAVIFIIRREKSKRKVRRMCMPQKVHLLEELAEPFGFSYIVSEDVFVTRLDAWQKSAGYEAVFDRAAEHFNMIFDALPVYFDYQGRTWLIEFWKGQYGINTGAEIGIYHADKIIGKEHRKLAHFDAVSEEEMPLCALYLEKNQAGLFRVKARHWWLAAFRMGEFSEPEQLLSRVVLTFKETTMAEAFLQGLKEAEVSLEAIGGCCNEVEVTFTGGKAFPLLRRTYRALVQVQNHFLCRMYRLVTRPFTNTVERMLFLYFLLPGCFGRMLRFPSRTDATKNGKRKKWPDYREKRFVEYDREKAGRKEQ